MEARITYRSEIYIEGQDLEDIRNTFESLNLDPISKNEVGVTDYGFVELVSVEDADTYKDLMDKWDKWKGFDE